MARDLSPTIQNLYAQILELLLSNPGALSADGVHGSLKTRKNRGLEYAYWQYRDIGGTVRHWYLGALADPDVQERIRGMQAKREGAIELKENLRPLARAWAAGGGMTPPKAAYRLLERLAERGLFSQGAVLIGTPAFLAVGSQRGVSWGEQQIQTQDVDIAASNDVVLVFPDDPPVDIPSIMHSLSESFHAVPSLDHKQPSTSWKLKGSELKVDFLVSGPRTGSPARVLKSFQPAAEPLWNLGYLVDEATTEAALIGASSAILIRLPDAARLAVHKVFVAEERPATFSVKKRKDLLQADALIHLLRRGQDEDLLVDAMNAAQRYPGMIKRLHRGACRLPTQSEWMVERIEQIERRADPDELGPGGPMS